MPSAEQQRASAIRAFREELARIQGDPASGLDAGAFQRLCAYHDAELARLAAQGDVDLTQAAARLSTGMRIATLLGTMALSAAYALFVSAHWGALALPLQLALVSVPTLLLLGLTHLAAVKERSGYVAALLATVAAIAFATNLAALGALYNLPDTRNALLAVGLFALLLAYGYGLTLPLIVGIGGLGGWLWSLGAVPLGLWWRQGFGLMEPLILVGVLALAAPTVVRGPARFAPWWRGMGAAAVVLALLVAGQVGNLSMFRSLPARTVEHGYQLLGAVALPALVAWGIRREQRIVTWIGSAGAVLYLYIRLADWFWDLLPRWLFFLVVGAVALLVLFALRRLRRAQVEGA